MEINPNLSENAKRDYALVTKAIQLGDQKAYAKLMHMYNDSIYYMLLKMVNNRDDAMDLTIETFGKAFNHLEKYRPEFAFSTWLFRIATNNCIDFIRKKKLNTFSIDQPIQEDGDRGFDIPSNSLDPEEKMIRKQKESLMHDVVDKLPPRYKRLVILRYFEEKSYEEIAVELQLPLGTVKAQLFRSRDLLSNIMRRAKETI